MKHFYLIVNREKRSAEHAATLISDYLMGRGCICLLSPPPSFLRLCGEIAAWAREHADPSLRSERFGEYSRTLEHRDWTQAFAAALAPFYRMYTEVNL